jgi:hypothetical protein
MKNILIISILFCWLLLNCKTPIKNKITDSLVLEGYKREYGTAFQYTSLLNDTTEGNFYYNSKYGNQKRRKSFFDLPSIKDSIALTIGFDQSVGGSCIDTVDVYINNMLWYSGKHPYSRACRRYTSNLLDGVEGIYLNTKKEKNASILILFRNDKIYFDTIIPLRFKQIIIGHPNHGFFIKFGKAID